MASETVLYAPPGGKQAISLNTQLISDKYQYKYPGDETKAKPTLNVIACPDKQKGYTSILQGFTTGKFILDEVCSYIVTVWKLLESVCDSDWVSYKLTIGRQGERVTPSNIFTVTTDPAQGAWAFTGNVANPSDADHLTLVGNLMALYRLSKIRENVTGTYKKDLSSRLEGLLSTSPFTKIIPTGSLHVTATANPNWHSNPTFRKIAGGLDMFLMKFESEFSGLRLGTVVTAYEDCSGLTSLTYYTNRLGLKGSEAVSYFFHVKVGEDLQKLWKVGQEIEKPDSYFVHFKALGLIGKSPYASSAVGYLYNCIHFTGSYMGDPRSLNAVVISDSSPNELSVLGGYIGYAFLGRGSFERVLFRDQEDKDEFDQVRESKEDIEQEGSISDFGDNALEEDARMTPTKLYNYMVANGYSLTEEMKFRFKSVSSSVVPRPGTFAEFLKNAYGLARQ
ncbi:nucleoprotein [Frog lyssa-like virus 1]|uniref:Nucleoprotein n=1 Tax=Frog lyssa-like virus 1 TaxID=2571313 RepID=A0A6G5RU48_9RHAB|nr:nucleoprotein [Frog lyssa-like virus 1]QCF24328.1 nucleoprotein [Frog lyssa-like virus 1]QCF24333.1 nucleoprotein [Frog lyssa-like virus 1]